ncbi:uncharacterized protein LOC110982858 isoform X2 [Acanthaster planci]|nr:uncharacterized protein LOC110982858 isoform X2 [Acanthaster planci]XP_022097277.1 uncharacterized protein LOC110982858 isoform X2 [Acanthaster planci]
MRPAPDYNNPPTYSLDDLNRRSQLPYSQHSHNYEELPFPPVAESSTDDVVQEDKPAAMQRQGSHTEVDQYFNPAPVHSISSTPLTLAEPPEKKPRKKVNPIYDRYEGPTEKVTTSRDGYPKSSSRPPSKGPCLGRCLRHPLTIVVIFVLVAVVIVALVLLMLGKIETPASSGSSDKQILPTVKVTDPPVTTPSSFTGGSVNDELLKIVRDQQLIIQDLQRRIGSLESMLGGGGEVNASLSTKVAMNTIKIENIQDRITPLEDSVTELQASLTNSLSSLEATKSRTAALENSTHSLQTQVASLGALVVTQGQRINENGDKNTAQDADISSAQQSITILQQEFQHDLFEVNRTIYGELDTISKMPGPRGFNGSEGPPGPAGPQGQQGAGDLSQCDYQKLSDSSAGSSVSVTRGPWTSPTADKIFTAFTCSTKGGTLANLETDTQGRYRCVCTGWHAPSDGSTDRKCYSHYWRCPKTS